MIPKTDWLTARVRATPVALALISGDQQWSYRELDQVVNRYCLGLQQAGVAAGHHIAVLLPNRLPYVALIHALARIGAVLVPLNTRLTAAEIQWQLTQSDAQLLIHGEEFADVVGQLVPDASCRFVPLATLATEAEQESEILHTPPFQLDAPQAIVFTSGTTGRPKGAVLSFANHFWGATASSYRLGLSPQDRWLSCLPLYHVGGLAVVFRSSLYGTAIVLHERFDLDAFDQSLDNDAITLTSVVPTMLHRLLTRRQGKPWPASLRHILLGGAAATPELLELARHSNAPVATTYGLTEAASQIATMRPEAVIHKPGSVGKPLMFSTVRIVDEAGKTLPAGEKGEIVVSGPTVMVGYYKNPEATAKVIRANAAGGCELYTGDIGYLDEDGDLWPVQRRSDLIVSGGENVYPAEVEAVLRQHPAVADACVVGIPDPEWGERVAALVACHPNAQVTEEALATFTRARLAGYKQPRLIRFIDALPQTASEKIERHTVCKLLTA
ncbi:MAG: o-succinylbenzoate--CoA ligase [Caldilineaceae bacterium]